MTRPQACSPYLPEDGDALLGVPRRDDCGRYTAARWFQIHTGRAAVAGGTPSARRGPVSGRDQVVAGILSTTLMAIGRNVAPRRPGDSCAHPQVAALNRSVATVCRIHPVRSPMLCALINGDRG